MPEKENKEIMLRIRITKEEAQKIDELAKEMEMSKSRLIRNLVLGGLEDAEFLQKVGILPLVKNLVKFTNQFKK